MKLHLLAGGFLLTAASVYGITDYMNTKNKKEFQQLYKETPVTLNDDIQLQDLREEDFSRGKLEPVLPSGTTISNPVRETQTKKMKRKRTAVNDQQKIEVAPMNENEHLQPPTPVITVPPPPPPVEKKKLKKKLNLKMYSRGAIREELPLPVDSIRKEF
jgi:hypothetical protein